MESQNLQAHAQHVMSEVFAQAGANSISDIQIRSGNYVYCHTKKGLEIIGTLGELPSQIVMAVIEFLYDRQESGAGADAARAACARS